MSKKLWFVVPIRFDDDHAQMRSAVASSYTEAVAQVLQHTVGITAYKELNFAGKYIWKEADAFRK